MGLMTAADAAHLLRRAGFGGTPAEIDALTGVEQQDAVDAVLDVSGTPDPVPPGSLADPDTGDWEKVSDLQKWWIDRMRTATLAGLDPGGTRPRMLQEKLTLLWHGHFTSSNEKVNCAEFMYAQNALYRREGMGGFQALTEHMAVEPAMLVYLDNEPNTKRKPNENFARELMELFMLGVNEYTEDDVLALARAWTGHNLVKVGEDHVYRFVPAEHDMEPKTFMGVTANWDGLGVPEAAGPGAVHFLCTTEPHATKVARFVARKVWSFLAHPNPPEATLAAVAGEFLASGLDLRVLVRAVLLHPDFWSPAARRGLVRTPVEFVVAALRALDLTPWATNPQWWMEQMGQELFYPPNVSGWRPNQYWISANATWGRANLARSLTWKKNQAEPEFLRNDHLAVPDAVQQAFAAFGIDDPSPRTRAVLEEWLTAQRAAPREWRNYQWINLWTLLLLCPDFQLA